MEGEHPPHLLQLYVPKDEITRLQTQEPVVLRHADWLYWTLASLTCSTSAVLHRFSMLSSMPSGSIISRLLLETQDADMLQLLQVL